MKNKVLIQLIVPEIELEYDIYIPVSKKIGNIIKLLSKSIFELSDGIYIVSEKSFLYNCDTGEKYDLDKIVKDTDIRNGTKLTIM